MKHAGITTAQKAEKAILVGVDSRAAPDSWSIESSLDELALLASSAGAQVVGRLSQKLDRPSQSMYLGKGKLEILVQMKESTGYEIVIFNDELLPRQQRNLEDAVKAKIIDRTALILDIFARRAQTKEGKLQVELAQHEYLLPRLAGQWSHLERLGGGIGTRGPGESQLETDRRIIRDKIRRLQKQLESVRQHRKLYRQNRERSRIPVVALVGYTNAGKSTLLNALSSAGVLEANKLFSTLDPVTRRLVLPNRKEFLLTDTVGFIHKLPPSIVAAFRATLEELSEADLLLHIVDITHKNASEQFEDVRAILAELNLLEKPAITVINKIDLLVKDINDLDSIQAPVEMPGELAPVHISARKGWGLETLLQRIAERIFT